MSISNNSDNNKRDSKKSTTQRYSLGVFIITSMLLTVSGFALISYNMEPLTRASAQEDNNNTEATTPTTATDTSSGIKLSPQPIMQERTITESTTPINQTHEWATFSGNGTLTLPNTTETINYTTNGSALISLVTHSAQAKETITTEQGETATATFYEIVKFDPAAEGEGKGLTMAIIHTDSTGMLAPLNGTIVAGINDMQPTDESNVTLWEWESGIGNNTSITDTPQ
jgi:hypothetical protein